MVTEVKSESMGPLYLEFLSNYEKGLSDRIDEGTRMLMEGDYEGVMETLWEDAGGGSDIPDLRTSGILPNYWGYKGKEKLAINKIKKTYGRGYFAHGLAEGAGWMEESGPLDHISGIGGNLSIYVDKVEESPYKYEFLGRGLAGMGFMKEGLEILLKSKYDDIDKFVTKIIFKRKIIYPKFTPEQFGFDKNMKSVKK
jgi:hypothetical protein